MRNRFQVLSNTSWWTLVQIFLLISFWSIIEWHPQPPRHSRERRRQFTTSLGTVKPSFKVIWDTCQNILKRTDPRTHWLRCNWIICEAEMPTGDCYQVWGVRCKVSSFMTKYKQPPPLSGSSRKVSITDPGLSSVKGKCPKWDNLFPIRAVPSCSNGHWLFFFADFCWDTRNFHALKWLLIIVKIVEPR